MHAGAPALKHRLGYVVLLSKDFGADRKLDCSAYLKPGAC